MAKIIATIKAIITRLVFASHGFIAIWQVTTFKKNPSYWYLSCPIILLFFEGVFTIIIKINHEWKWFCPSVFLYLASVIPAIWLIELDKLDGQIKPRVANINISETFDLTNLAAEDLKHLEKIFGVNFKLPEIKISTETWVTLIEQFLMLVLIIGRWMLPKGDLTRDQLSQLLLVYIGTAADIIEFFDSFKEERIRRELMLVYLTLGIWSWSLMQFTVVLTATKSRKSRLSSGATIKHKLTSETSCCSIDVWAIAINMILQDAPFLAFRLIIIIHYQILYRLYVVQSENKIKKKRKRRRNERREVLSNVNVISRNDLYKYEYSKNRKRRRGDIEKVVSKSKDYLSEQQDTCDSSSEHRQRSKRNRHMRQDILLGYSTGSTHNTSKHGKILQKERKRTSSYRDVSPRIDVLSYDSNIEKELVTNKTKKLKKIDAMRSAMRDKSRCTKVVVEKNDKVVNYESTEDSQESASSNNSDTDSEQRYVRHGRRNRV